MKYIISILVILFLIATSCYILKDSPKNKPEKENINPEIASVVLKNLARAMRTYSNLNGGGGHSNFTADWKNIEPYVMGHIKDSFPCNKNLPFKGLYMKLEEYPQGDNYKTNFLFTVYPAEGFIGESYCIDKKEKIFIKSKIKKGTEK